ncbi:MAG: hypothetical protein CL910_11370 [Deltaproteobacteria bacterium]|nr:hypothetical protein [Deltaproteobacteria bacterium]
MPKEDNFTFKPDFSDAGSKSAEGDGAQWTWFSPVDENETRMRYPIIKEEDGILSILPDEGRFKRGLMAWRYPSEEAEDHTVWLVLKVRPNRIDLRSADDPKSAGG